MAIHKTEAIVLNSTRLRETSLITTFYTRSFGKLKALSKGVRQEGSALISLYEPFNHVQIVFYEKTRSDIHFLSESSLVHFFSKLRTDLSKISWAAFLLELVDTVVPPEEANEELFLLLVGCLRQMEKEPASPFVSIFEVKLLWGSGLFPALGSCIQCGRKDFDTAYLSVEEGGIFCGNCRDAHRGFVPLSMGLVKTIDFYASNDLDKCLALKISPSCETELHRLIHQWVRGRFEKDLATVRFLKEVDLI